MTPEEAWDKLVTKELWNQIGGDDAMAGFIAGYQIALDQESNKPYFCAFCTFEYHGESNEATLSAIQEHVRVCEFHPLAIENRRLQEMLEQKQ
jgi:hypothetical protein